jgi:hypothetical protein
MTFPCVAVLRSKTQTISDAPTSQTFSFAVRIGMPPISIMGLGRRWDSSTIRSAQAASQDDRLHFMPNSMCRVIFEVRCRSGYWIVHRKRLSSRPSHVPHPFDRPTASWSAISLPLESKAPWQAVGRLHSGSPPRQHWSFRRLYRNIAEVIVNRNLFRVELTIEEYSRQCLRSRCVLWSKPDPNERCCRVPVAKVAQSRSRCY